MADNIKEIIPEFLLLLRGVLDCPDLPLNVSRSFLQNDGYVRKLSAHITKKVADKLDSLMNTEREKYADLLGRYPSLRQVRLHPRRQVPRSRQGQHPVQDHRGRISDAGGIPRP